MGPREKENPVSSQEEKPTCKGPTWDEAKKRPVSTQEEIGDRWKDAEKDG